MHLIADRIWCDRPTPSVTAALFAPAFQVNRGVSRRSEMRIVKFTLQPTLGGLKVEGLSYSTPVQISINVHKSLVARRPIVQDVEARHAYRGVADFAIKFDVPFHCRSNSSVLAVVSVRGRD